MNHLERVRHAMRCAVDRDRASETSIGIAPEWKPAFRATLKDGRIVAMAFECVGEDDEVGASWTFALAPGEVAPITVPQDATPSHEAVSL